MAYRIGVDSGGTFTDVVLFNEASGKMSIAKTPSTPQDPSIGVYNAICKITESENISLDQVTSLIHGTTVATNAILEYKGSPTALITTEGFIDILSIVRQDRPQMYDYFKRRHPPLIPRHLRFEVPERVVADGSVLTPLDEAEAIRVIDRIRAMGIETIAVCLLHAYMNPIHEQRLKALITRGHPEAKVSLSSEILPEIREYERMSTTAINAYVMPKIEAYLSDLTRKIDLSGSPLMLNVMQSNGGILRAGAARKRSVATILSGPAGGVLGSQLIARNAGVDNVITLDMGGTSADICLIAEGKFLSTNENWIGGHAIKVPMIDINTIGAGGGSIAWIDSGGLLRVGPESSGADPGPVCYDKGGRESTVTDANLVLGRLNPHYYVGGEMGLNIEKARLAIQEKIAGPMGMSIEQAAEGIIKVVNANMMRGIRLVSVERGHDPRNFSLLTFGGGGSLHAVDLARDLNIPRVIIPKMAGVNSAVGLLVADFRYDYSRTYLTTLRALDFDKINCFYDEMVRQARQEMTEANIDEQDFMFQRSIDLRYYGQGYEIEVPLADGFITPDQIRQAARHFDRAHRNLYGFSHPDQEKQTVYLRVAAFGRVKKPEFHRESVMAGDSPPVDHCRKVFIDGNFEMIPIYKRSHLKPGHRLEGPAIIEQMDTTTLIKQGHTAGVNPYADLIVNLTPDDDSGSAF